MALFYQNLIAGKYILFYFSIFIIPILAHTHWHIDADEAFLLSYFNDERARLLKPDVYRCSDYDPVIIGLDLTN